MVKSKSKANSKDNGLEIELGELKKAALTLRAINHKVRQNILNLIHKNKEIKDKQDKKEQQLQEQINRVICI